MIYMDYNATSPMKPAVAQAMLEAMQRVGNPSSVHRYGRTARKYVEQARSQVAALAGAKPVQVIFTASGTEANNMALRGIKAQAIYVSAIEHDAVLAVAPQAIRLPVTESGLLDLKAAESILSAAPVPSLVALMLVNNETGVIQPIADFITIARRYGHLVHGDAVQAAGKIPLDFTTLGLDSMALSAHKIGGPQGVGALIMRENLPLQPLIVGGGQELRRRAGTENVAGIVGFGVAAQLAADDLRHTQQLQQWRDEIETGIRTLGDETVMIIGADAPRVANTLCVALKNVTGETQVMAMDLSGVAVSSGSACSSGKVKSSHVLKAMNLPDSVVGSALRISLGWNTQAGDVEKCLNAWRDLFLQTRRGKSDQSAAA